MKKTKALSIVFSYFFVNYGTDSWPKYNDKSVLEKMSFKALKEPEEVGRFTFSDHSYMQPTELFCELKHKHLFLEFMDLLELIQE